MPETLTTVQWNIGGGKIRETHAADDTAYDIDGLEAIIDTLEQTEPDLITLQETHTDEEFRGFSHARIIAEALGLPHWVNDLYGESHIDPNYQIGQAIISRFPITQHAFRLFIDPGYTAEWATRKHDKGVTSVALNFDEGPLLAQTLHAVPFRAFGVDQESEQAKPVLDDMQTRVLGLRHNPRLLQGDFNLHGASLTNLLPTLFDEDFEEVVHETPTTPNGRIYDHVLFSGLTVLSSTVLAEALTDHYPVVTSFAHK